MIVLSTKKLSDAQKAPLLAHKSNAFIYNDYD